MAALYDGVPGDPAHPKRTAIILKKDDDAFTVVEAGLSAGQMITGIR
ncbi:MAG TPA: hypothetical protein HPP97_08890 [Desulfuromonadales bacterium]|nr:hypothetical protein [Desulfuromonadales bacterium]